VKGRVADSGRQPEQQLPTEEQLQVEVWALFAIVAAALQGARAAGDALAGAAYR
jgi:hypothetical protein